VKTRPVEENPVQSTTYTWDAAASLPVIIQETTNEATTSYVYGLDLLSMADDSDVTRYFLQDGLGSTTGLTDDTGAVIGTFDYDVFGALRGQTGDADTNWRFTGELQDLTVGEAPYYLRARYYDPAIGRFLSQDPWPTNPMNPQTANLYVYGLNNPALYVDPFGYWGLKDAWNKTKNVASTVGGAIKQGTQEVGESLGQVGRPLAGAAIIIVADLPVAIGEPLCILTVWSGVTCIAVNAYVYLVATPTTYVGLCMMAEDNFFDIPGLDGVCGSDKARPKEPGKE
jgi:RHS repeat-associated protein